MHSIPAEMSKIVRGELVNETIWVPIQILAFGQEGKDGDTWPVAIVRVIDTHELRHVELKNIRGVGHAGPI